MCLCVCTRQAPQLSARTLHTAKCTIDDGSLVVASLSIEALAIFGRRFGPEETNVATTVLRVDWVARFDHVRQGQRMTRVAGCLTHSWLVRVARDVAHKCGGGFTLVTAVTFNG